MILNFLMVSIPSILCTCVFCFQHLVNMWMVGHLGDTTLLAAIGLGNMIQNCFFIAPIVGMNCAIETLASQTAGSNDIELAGVYLNRGRVVVVSIIAIQCLFGLNTSTILQLLGQDQKVSELAHAYILFYMPALFFFGLADLQRKFLNSFRKNMLPLLSFMVAVGLHPLWCKILVFDFDMGLQGIALAALLSNILTFVLMTLFFRMDEDLKKACVMPDRRSI